MSDLRRWDTLHPGTRAVISEVLEWHEQTDSGGRGCCEPHGDKWFICSYHEGYDDALEEAEAAATDNKDVAIEAMKIVRLEDEVKRLRADNQALLDKNERLRAEKDSMDRLDRESVMAIENLRARNERLRAEVARLESLGQERY